MCIYYIYFFYFKIIAKKQKTGRGRFDRSWESPVGGIYLSLILKPEISVEKSSILPLAASLSVLKTIKKYNLNPKIKWPNDVRILNKKIAGILLESQITENKFDYIIIGFGINLNINQFSKNIKKNSTSLSIELKRKINYIEFLTNLFSNIDLYFQSFDSKKIQKIITEWKKNTDTIGKKVKIQTIKNEIIGIAQDIDEYGYLEIKDENNFIHKITNGDCIHLDD